MQDTQQLWDALLGEVEVSVSKANFNTWFKDTHILKEEDDVLYIGVPNEFVREWLITKYHKAILRVIRKLTNHIRSVKYVIVTTAAPEKTETEEPETPITNKLPLSNLYIDKKDNLNPRYTFENFIIGPFNELAYSASQAIIKEIGVYNPLFIYGPTGLGKTHLIQAVGNTIKKNYPETRVYYTSSEKFTTDLVSSLQNNRINSFKDKYRKYDVLIMDDIQFLSGKDKTQEELFHLFNILYDNNKQIIFSSDKHPNYIVGLEDRLRSRFSAGMIVDVSKPDYESRMAMLRTKAGENAKYIQPEIFDYIATNVEGNIRELEGILNSLICQLQIKNREITQQDVKSLIKNSIRPKRNVSVPEIVKIVADFYNLDERIIYEKTRRKEVVRSRQVAMYLLREDFNISYPLIGKKLGGRDHTTVIHSCLKVKNALETDTELSQEIEQLRAMLTT